MSDSTVIDAYRHLQNVEVQENSHIKVIIQHTYSRVRAQ